MSCTVKQKECGKVALITGTTSGIGYAFCEKFAQEKTDIILVSRNHEKLEEQQEYLQNNFGIKTWIIQQDLESPEAAQNVYAEVRNLKINVDYLVHNAGFNESGKFIETNIEKHIPGIYNKFMVISSRISPASLIDYLTMRMLTKK